MAAWILAFFLAEAPDVPQVGGAFVGRFAVTNGLWARTAPCPATVARGSCVEAAPRDGGGGVPAGAVPTARTIMIESSRPTRPKNTSSRV